MKIKNIVLSGAAALAPMAGVADRAFRELCAGFGAAYVVSEMVSAKGIAYNSKKSAELMVVSQRERPCGVQIFGDDPKTMAQAAEFALRYKPDIIDINMGCPAPKIVGNGGGSALMKQPELCGNIVRQVVNTVDIPVTVKIRKGWDDDSVNAVEVAKICQANGAAAITVHGRTRQQYYSPPVDYNIIAAVKQAVTVPVIGNGDVQSGQDAQRLLEQTNCDMVMVGRGALGNPWIFREINYYLETGNIMPSPTPSQKVSVMVRHIEQACEYKGEYIAMKEARKHVGYYLKGLRNAAALRKEAGTLSTLDDLYAFARKVHEAAETKS